MLSGLQGEAAAAIPTAPGTAPSYYVKTINLRALFRWGCQQGVRMKQHRSMRDSIVVLDFGRPVRRHPRHAAYRYGVSLFRRKGFVSTQSVQYASEAFAHGVWVCSKGLKAAHVRIAIGTTNFGVDVTWAHGYMWATVVNRANDWLQARGYGSKIDFAGGNDIEPARNTPKATRNWVHGYEAAAQHPYYNYGAADQCPPRGNCAGAWTLEDVWYVSWGAPHAWPLPEIYTPNWANANQWYRIALYSYLRHGSRMLISGVMSQRGACRRQRIPCRGMNNTPDRAWKQLFRLLNGDPRTRQSPRWTTDIR